MLQATFNKLCAYDPADLVATFGALQLVPQNVHHTIRLEAYAQAAASRRLRSVGNAMTVSELSAFLHDDGLPTILHMQEDPCSNLLTETLLFRGGGYVVFPGIADSITFIMRNLAKALFLRNRSSLDRAFRNEAEHLIGAALALSDAIAARIGLTRWLPTAETDGGPTVPDPQRLDELKRAVRWPSQALKGELSHRGIRPFAIEPLIGGDGRFVADGYDCSQPTVSRWPIIRFGDDIVVGSPGSLLFAAVNAVVELADQRGVLPGLADEFNAAVWDSMRRSLEYLGLRAMRPVPLPHGVPCLHDGVVQCDDDKLMHVLVATDPLDSLSTWGRRQPLERSERVAAIMTRVREVASFLLSRSQGQINDLVHLVILQGLTRDELFAFNAGAEPASRVLWLSGEAMEMISWAEGGNPLALWHFIEARERVRQRTEISCFDIADEYAFYAQHKHGFYASDERLGGLAISPGFCAATKLDLAQKYDLHATLSHDGRHVFEVVRLHGKGVPIYAPLKDMGQRAVQLVEGLAPPCWILGPVYETEDARERHTEYAHIVDAVGYWIWQISPSLSPVWPHLGLPPRGLHVSVQLSPAQPSMSASEPATCSDCGVIAEASTGSIRLTFHPSFANAVAQPDNAAERYLVRTLLLALRDLLPRSVAAAWDDTALDRLVDSHVPLGIKKKLLGFNTATTPALHPSDALPPSRKIQEAKIEGILDTLGDEMAHRGWDVGPVPDSDCDRFLNHVVESLYRRFAALIGSMSPTGLLHWLIAHHERLTYDDAFLGLTLPTRIACFSNETEVRRELEDELSSASRARLANRFIIEYVAACPSRGIRPISLAVYDELMAMASEIINFGSLSDLCHFQIEDIRWSILQSGRIGRAADHFLAARDAYLSVYAQGHIHRSRRGFFSHWQDRNRQPGELQDQINAAMLAELGIKFTDIMDILGFATSVGLAENAAVCSLGQRQFIERAANELGFSESLIRQALDALVLDPRPDYLKPPVPFRREDIYPWRLDRALSYVRRPFIRRREGDQDQLLWGPRNADAVARYWCSAWLHGRIEAKSKAMKRLVSGFHNDRGRDFNDRVAEALERLPGVIVKRRVAKIGKLRPPGDIDVLVAVPATRKLRLVECKDLSPARMPHEINAELLKIFTSKPGQRSAIEKHKNRLEWVVVHAGEVLNFLGCNDGGDWKAEAIFVTETELLTPFLRDPPMRFVPFASLDSII